MMGIGKGRASARRRRQEVLERPEYGWIWKPLLAALVLYLVVVLALGVWWSRSPARFDVEQAVLERRGEQAGEPAQRGAVTTATLAATLATLLDKPGGYLRNDVAPPGLWLDNMPHWELGVLQQVRDLALVLPDMEQGDATSLDEAAERLMGDGRDWFYPSTEVRLDRAVEALDGHLAELNGDGGAGFGPGAGLSDWLSRVATRLDDLGQRLSASVGSREELRRLDLAGDELPPKTPWYRVDNIFFEARGSGWGLIQLLEGVQRDQADVLAEAGVSEAWTGLIAELERTQRRLWSPVVLNGSGFGPFANHSLIMAHHVTRARDLARSLAQTLDQTQATVPEAPVDEPLPSDEEASDEDVAPEAADEGATPEAAEEGAAEEATEEEAVDDGEVTAPADAGAEAVEPEPEAEALSVPADEADEGADGSATEPEGEEAGAASAEE